MKHRLKHQLFIYLSTGLVVFFALLNINIPTPTGQAIVSGEAQSVNHVVEEFFTVNDIVFPLGACGEVARNIYHDIATTPVDVSAGFSTNGPERLATINFVTDRIRRFGTIDMIHGPIMLAEDNVDAMISVNVESLVTVPKSDRENFLSFDLLGFAHDMFYVTKGRFSTPSLDCVFASHNGDTACECDAHAISGIEVAGITGIRQDETKYDQLITRIQQRQR